MRPQQMDELLERVWTEREKGRDGREDVLAALPAGDGERWLKKLEQERLVSETGGRVRLTSAGEKEASAIIRRHRLTERLFADVFNTREETWEREACELEHPTVLTEEAVNAICAFLGHPPTCPHGRPIPPGPCCAEFRLEVKSFVIPLTEARLASRYRIVFITPKSGLRLDRLAVLGILPGSEIRIHQKKPAYVLRIGETDVALDHEIVRDIYVKEAP
jgi:DtxR family Mn-dependent transcriptional regulator